MENIKWVAIDWGTTNLRAFAINADGDVIAERGSDDGMGRLEPHQFEEALIKVVEPWLSNQSVMPIYTCGMVGARQGWKEAVYKNVPAAPASIDGLTIAPTTDPRIDVKILPGLSQDEPADVMRGEETQIAGLLKLNPTFEGAVCLPGTHSKWVTIKHGAIMEFHTYMTGELFSLLSSQSVLRHSLSDGGEDYDAFLEAAKMALDKPENVMANLFSIRASSLLSDADPIKSRARLSGMIVGQELSHAKSYWSNQKIIVIGSEAVSDLYVKLLKSIGCQVDQISAREASLAGLKLIAEPLLAKSA